MNDRRIPLSDIRKELEHYLSMETAFSDGRVLGSMCTAPHPLAVEAHRMFIESNLGNPGLYPGSVEMEGRVMEMLAKLLNGPGCSGLMVGGGTEANITALWVAKKLQKKREVIFSSNAHFSIKKAIDLLNLDGVEVGLDDRYRISIDEVEDAVTDETLAMVGVAGTTELGMIDPIDRLSDLAAENYFLHVDGAFGGFVIPFLRQIREGVPKFDLSLKGVNSISLDPHKMGLSTIPSGALMLRDMEYLEGISVDSPYLTSSRNMSLAGTRCSAAVASTYAVMRHLGNEGYIEVVRRCMAITDRLAEGIEELGREHDIEVAIKPVLNIVAARIPDHVAVKEELERKGWYLSVSRHPEALRLVVMPHITMERAEELLSDLETVLNARR